MEKKITQTANFRVQAIRCPVCKEGRILNRRAGNIPDMIRVLPPERADRAYFFVKCPRCKTQIGIAINRVK